jgi:hypothetical protein
VCCPCADTFIQKTKKLFQDTRSQRNMAALTADLAEVHTIMSKNIAEVLGQGEKLDSKCCSLPSGCGRPFGTVQLRSWASDQELGRQPLSEAACLCTRSSLSRKKIDVRSCSSGAAHFGIAIEMTP